jgi:hypothetical protein
LFGIAPTVPLVSFGSLKLAGGSGFYSNQRLYGPDGKLLMNFIDNNSDNFFTYQTTNNGTFALLVDSTYASYSGSYRLRLAHIPRAFVVPPGDEGGALRNEIWQEAILDPGDIDLWTFPANQGDSFRVSVTNVTWNAYTGFRVSITNQTAGFLAALKAFRSSRCRILCPAPELTRSW